MSLPKIAISTFKCILPDAGTEIKYRGFNVKEEKILLLAAATKTKKFADIFNKVEDIVSACCLTNLETGKMSAIDFEYMFLKIKSASKGSIEELKYKCKVENSEGIQCGAGLHFSVDFDQVKLSKEFPEPIIKLQDDLTVKLKIPTLADIVLMQETELDELELLAVSLDYVHYKEETSSEFTMQEALEFLEQLSSSQLKPLVEYYESMPKLQYTHNIKCKKCGHQHELVLAGLESFFM